MLHAVDPNEVFPRGLPVDPSSESDCSLSEDQSSPVTMVTTQVDPAAVYQVVYDLSGLASVKPEPGQENVISIELGEFHATTVSFCVACVHDNGPRKQEEELRSCQISVIRTTDVALSSVLLLEQR